MRATRPGQVMSTLFPTVCAVLGLALVACGQPDAAPSEPSQPVGQQTAARRAMTGAGYAVATLPYTPTNTSLTHGATPVARNTVYRAHLWAKGGGYAWIDILDGSRQKVITNRFIWPKAEWERFDVAPFDTGENTTISFSVRDREGGREGSMYLDDAHLGLAAGGPNLLSNAGFERGGQDWSGSGAFRVARDLEPTNASVPASASVPRTGSWLAVARLTADRSYAVLKHQAVSVSRQTMYSATIWARGGGRLDLNITNGAETTSLGTAYFDATPEWRRYGVRFNTRDNDVIHFEINDRRGGQAGTVYLDDANVSPEGGGPNVLTNPGFESGEAGWIPEDVFSVVRGVADPSQPPSDGDGDGVPDARDNCPTVDNPDQLDENRNGIGSACDGSETSQNPPGPDPDAVTFAEVHANGSGCPRNTWNTRISSDGLVFTTTFSSYEVRLNPSIIQDVKDCQLAIRLHTPEGRSFSVQSFAYSGFALLQAGVTGRQLASYSFQGQTVRSRAARTDLVGPYEEDFLFRDEVPIEDAVWSPCGLERELNVTTRLVLQSERPGPSGYMNMTSADGSARLILRLTSRNCNEFGGIR